MDVNISQLGGHSGSYAGDCALVRVNDDKNYHFLLIDLGASRAVDLRQVRGAMRDFFGQRALKASDRRVVLLTHFHKDHARGTAAELAPLFSGGEGRNWSLFSGRGLEGQEGEWSAGFGSAALAQHGAPIIQESLDGGKFQFEVRTIVPEQDKFVKAPTTENHLSVGAHIRLLAGDRPILSFLSLGDMDEAMYRGYDVLEDYFHVTGINPAEITLIKYPHHGSGGSNYLHGLNAVLDASHAHVIISGWTSGEINKVLTSLLKGGAASVQYLVTDETREELNGLLATIKDLNRGLDAVSVSSGWRLQASF